MCKQFNMGVIFTLCLFSWPVFRRQPPTHPSQAVPNRFQMLRVAKYIAPRIAGSLQPKQTQSNINSCSVARAAFTWCTTATSIARTWHDRVEKWTKSIGNAYTTGRSNAKVAWNVSRIDCLWPMVSNATFDLSHQQRVTVSFTLPLSRCGFRRSQSLHRLRTCRGGQGVGHAVLADDGFVGPQKARSRVLRWSQDCVAGSALNHNKN